MITGQTTDGAYLAKATGDLTIYTATECLVQLRHMTGVDLDVVLDLSEVGEIDTAGVQLLIQARRERSAHGKPMQFASPSPAVQEIVQLLGLQAFLDIPSSEFDCPTMQGDRP